ncbi:ammonium transporter [Guillardia theta CCMP2712]|uniref:Ammonium transporter n=1 Tax=Guillardia theta (strain CCMP2712) TaxID=905079 RepID=L1I9F0_GUITC|nr:ammonium transporter [Guillardia theta CCMP2712]EKX32727.1 ammonium transporter [Guillardia theta CCMP2712]|eukprot:XP_005819707.1 ammonium transporter [Guillardia theta CCMP2712]
MSSQSHPMGNDVGVGPDTVAKQHLNLSYAGALVFFMQAGFAMLEAGIVHPKNTINILFKNMIDASIAAIGFWLIGYGFAYGKDSGGFIGGSNFALDEVYNKAGGCTKASDGSWSCSPDGWESWFFQWAFTGAAATIVAGSVCERTKIGAYFVYSIIITAFIYPVVVHWVWGTGWLSAWGAYGDNPRPLFTGNTNSNGMIDFAGSGVVHMVGGFSGLMGAIVVGPRIGRFNADGTVNELYAGNKTLQSLGAFILWFGWYGFNCGSTLAISGGLGQVAGKVAVNTTIAAAAGAIGATFITFIFEGHYDISMGLNGLLAGLVGVTANCSVVNPWAALIIGLVASLILYLGHYLLLKLKIDDPCDACIVHGFCGMWGVWSAGIFCSDGNIQYAGYPNVNNACARGEQFGVQIVGSLVVAAWVMGTAGMTFLAIDKTIGMRVSEDIEHAGLDASEHGAVQSQPVPLPQNNFPNMNGNISMYTYPPAF